MGTTGIRLGRSVVLATLLAAVTVGLPHPVSADQTPGSSGNAVVLHGDPAATVSFRPAYGDLPISAVPASADR
ncbi:MAG: hypothetical protein M9891_14225 [Austwickia sp.]|nr:hypothetical protein [Austwickia sp.]